MNKISHKELVELLELSEIATPGGWVLEKHNPRKVFTSIGWPVGRMDEGGICFGSGVDAGGSSPVTDAELICKSRNAIHSIVCELLNLRGVANFHFTEVDCEDGEIHLVPLEAAFRMADYNESEAERLKAELQ